MPRASDPPEGAPKRFLLDPKSKRLLGPERPPGRHAKRLAVAGALLAALTAGVGGTSYLCWQAAGWDSEEGLMAAFFGAAMGLLTVLFVWLLADGALNALPAAQRRDLLEEHGKVLDGELLDATGGQGPNRAWRVTVRYRFVSPEGRPVFAEARARRNDLKKARLPEPGTRLAVLYYAEDNYRLL